MSYQPRPSLYPAGSAANPSASQSQQSAALQARIAAKRAELQNLKELRELSATLAAQMSALEAKLGTLRDGTEAVACVMANWDGVLKAISMAGAKVAEGAANKKQNNDDTDGGAGEGSTPMDLPETLVRIPVGQQLQQDNAAQEQDGSGLGQAQKERKSDG